jgi:hypothetical protein
MRVCILWDGDRVYGHDKLVGVFSSSEKAQDYAQKFPWKDTTENWSYGVVTGRRKIEYDFQIVEIDPGGV